MALLWLAGMGKVRLFGIVTTLLACLAVTGCSPFGACPAIGWSNVVEVHLNGNVSEVASVELCVDGVCSTSTPYDSAPFEPRQMTTLGPEQLPSISPAPAATYSPYFSTRVDERTWKFQVQISTPGSVTLRALSTAGTVLAEKDVVLEWRRVGGTEQCGGPGVAGPVSLDIPS